MDLDVEGTLVSSFERRVRENPKNVAILDRLATWTYEELSRRVDQIAAALIAKGISAPAYIGLHLPPSADLIASLLAILKIGGAYVPIDRNAPSERVDFILRDSNARLVITDRNDIGRALDIGSITAGADMESRWPRPTIHLDAPAYVIYTSGSTGKPKGVICTHRNVMRLFSSTQKKFFFSESDRWTLFHSIAFDFSVWEVFGALLYGGTLVIVSPETARDTLAFSGLLVEQGITVLNQTPSAFYNLVTTADSRAMDCFSTIRCIVLGGERVQCAKLARWFDLPVQRRPRLVNMYGITETTVHVTYRELSIVDVKVHPNASPIGAPIEDLSVYLLGDDLEPVPNGDVGEICVAGPGVSQGYLNRPDVTAERFVPNPFDTGNAPVLYRSGDLGCFESDELFYVGRSDRQVKIRGYRIELGEIESALLAAPGVAASHVIALDAGSAEARLIACIIPEKKVRLEAHAECDGLIQTVRKSLTDRLPSYMIPSEIRVLSELPLTINGKVDDQKLATLERCIASEGSLHDGDPVERQIRQIWMDVLKLKEVGVDVSLDRVGAHSLAATMISLRLFKAFGVEVLPADLKGDASIASMAALVRLAGSQKPGTTEAHKKASPA